MRNNGNSPHSRVSVQGLERSFDSGDNLVRVLRGVLDRPNAGSICIDGQDILQLSEGKRATLRRKRIGFIFQSYTLMPTYTAYENVDLALRLPGIGFFERRKRAAA